MVFNFWALKVLKQHHHFLRAKINTSNFFLVGGCLRDLILWLTTTPEDIDFTMSWNPLELYEQINKEHLSHFITEKFWTITLIPQNQTVGNLKYELTPLRAETWYWDFRHPEEIFWSDDILLDYKRRDFSINAMYYTTCNVKTPQYKESKIVWEEEILSILNKEWFIYLENFETLIIQDEKLLSQCFPHAKTDLDFIYYLLDIQTYGYSLWEQKWDEKNTHIDLHIIIDPAHGLHDVYNKKIQTVWDPDTRFQEDALRLLRALRFVNVINEKLQKQDKDKPSNPTNKMKLFDFETETRKSVKRNHDLLKNIAKERIREELVKAFKEWNPFALVWLIDEAEMLSFIFPSLALTKHVDQPIRYHPFDVYTHILLTLYHLQQINDNYLVRFAMLYHDVWKVWQYAEYEKNLSREEIRKILSWPLNHRYSSAILAKEDFSNLNFSNKEIEEIERYIKEHHTPWEILQANPIHREKKLRKLLSENGFDRVNNLLDINIADRLWMYNPLQNASDLSDSRYLKDLLVQINEKEGQFTAKDLAVDGKDIMEHFHLTPWKIVWELLQVALDWVLGDIENRNTKKQIYLNLANHLKNRESEL